MPIRQVLILTYFYPPCNLTASQRPASWAKYLPDFGFRPIVVTRCWGVPVEHPKDLFHACGDGVRVERTERAEVHVVPYRPSLRDRLFIRHGDDRWARARRALTFMERIGEHISAGAVTYRGILHRAQAVVDENPSLRHVVITGSPFTMFRFGYELVQRHPRLRWVADYRDDWTTTPLSPHPPVVERMMRVLDRYSERRWVKTASHVTAVIDGYLRRVTAVSGRPGSVVMNGYDDELFGGTRPRVEKGVFRIVHAGTLFPSQPIEVFLRGVVALMRRWEDRIRVEVHFPGLAYAAEQAERVRKETHPFADRFFIRPRIPLAEAIALQQSSQVLLLVAHEGLDDIAPSKLYEAVGLRKPVLLCPSDDGVLWETLQAAGLGVVAATPEAVVARLSEFIEDYLSSGRVDVRPNETAIRRFSRREQARRLASVLDGL